MVFSFYPRKRSVCEHLTVQKAVLTSSFYPCSAEQHPAKGLRLRSNYTRAQSSSLKGAFTNKAIADVVVFTSPKFAFALHDWSRGCCGSVNFTARMDHPTLNWGRSAGQGQWGRGPIVPCPVGAAYLRRLAPPLWPARPAFDRPEAL